MTPFERNFMCHASSGTCSICGEWAMVIVDIATLQYKCLNCCAKEHAMHVEIEKQKKRIPLNLKEFAEL